MNLPSLPRFPMCPEQEEPEREIWQPDWHCYCCQDTGRATSVLASLVIAGYDPNRDRIPVCQAPGCRAGDKFMDSEFKGYVDMRLTATVCQQLDTTSRQPKPDLGARGMNLPNLPRLPMRPEQEQSDPEIWQPSWSCYCCRDSGRVSAILAALVIPDYDPNRDRIPVCQAPGCRAGDKFMDSEFKGCVDMRLTATVCQQLDTTSRQDWRNTVKAQQKRLVNLNCIKSLRQRPRTTDEEMLAHQKHQAALAEANSVRVVPQIEEVVDV